MFSDYLDTIAFVSKYDPQVGEAMEAELKRQRRNLELIASENIVSPAVMAAMGSVLTNKYAEGLPGKRSYGGCEFVDKVERIAIERACELFGANALLFSVAGRNTSAVFLGRKRKQHFRILERLSADMGASYNRPHHTAAVA